MLNEIIKKKKQKKERKESRSKKIFPKSYPDGVFVWIFGACMSIATIQTGKEEEMNEREIQ